MNLWVVTCLCGFSCYRAMAAEKGRKCPECRGGSLTSVQAPDNGEPVRFVEPDGTVMLWTGDSWTPEA